jgi:hypothetical protein
MLFTEFNHMRYFRALVRQQRSIHSAISTAGRLDRIWTNPDESEKPDSAGKVKGLSPLLQRSQPDTNK